MHQSKLYFLLPVFTATLAAQQTPQLDIIPYGGGTLGTVRFWNSGGAARKYAAWSGDATTATNCTHSLSDVLILPCVAYQVGLGRASRRFDSVYGRFIDLTSSATPTLAQLYVRRLASAGLISAVDDGAGQMVFTVSNGGVAYASRPGAAKPSTPPCSPASIPSTTSSPRSPS